MRNKTVLVTGGGGFMGSHLSEALVATGAAVRVLDDFSSGRADNLAGFKKRLELFEGSVADEDLVRNACRGVDAVVHAAFPMSARSRSMETGQAVVFTGGLLNLLKEAIGNEALFIYISSIAVYGNQKYVPVDEVHPLEPVMLHGAMKLAGEHFCRALGHSHGLKYVILRVADIYGPKNARVSAPVRFLLNALRGAPLEVHGTGRQSRTYTYVGDYVKAVLSTIATPEACGGIFNIAGDRPVTMHELALLARDLTGSSSEIVLRPNKLTDDRRLEIDGTPAVKILGLGEFTDIRSGLGKTLDWLRKNPDFYERRG